MKVRRFEWEGATETAALMREWSKLPAEVVDVSLIEEAVKKEGDAALKRLTARFDTPEAKLSSLRVDPADCADALTQLDSGLRESLTLAAANIRTVAEAQVGGRQSAEDRPYDRPIEAKPRSVKLSQGQVVTVREVPVAAAGLYAPGGRGTYPSSVLMSAIPARVAGVGRLTLASPPDLSGAVSPLVLAAAALCEVDEVYAVGGAQAIFALAYGTETITPVDIIAGPGNAWVREAKRRVVGDVGIDSLAGPSELMLVAGHDTDAEWAALDLCAQAEHGADGPLIVVAVEEAVLSAITEATETVARERPGVADALLAEVLVPDLSDAIDLANAFAPEHLELFEADAAL
ncbi:MAG: histidinol dehydrogenase, partial [Mycobacteriales bacterium]